MPIVAQLWATPEDSLFSDLMGLNCLCPKLTPFACVGVTDAIAESLTLPCLLPPSGFLLHETSQDCSGEKVYPKESNADCLSTPCVGSPRKSLMSNMARLRMQLPGMRSKMWDGRSGLCSASWADGRDRDGKGWCSPDPMMMTVTRSGPVRGLQRGPSRPRGGSQRGHGPA